MGNSRNKKNASTKLELFEDLKEIALITYEFDCNREDSIKSQATNMQAAFSFIVAAIVMAMPVALEYITLIKPSYLFFMFFLIYLIMGICLYYATKSQLLKISKGFLDIDEQKKYYNLNINSLLEKEERIDYFIKALGDVQKSKRKNLNDRIKYLDLSMNYFLIGLVLCLLEMILIIVYYSVYEIFFSIYDIESLNIFIFMFIFIIILIISLLGLLKLIIHHIKIIIDLYKEKG